MPFLTPRSVFSCTAVLVIGFIVLGCARPPDLAGIGGSYNILGPDRDFIFAMRSSDLPAHWHSKGKLTPNSLSIDEVQRVPGLHIEASASDYWFTREIHASLLATPYLSWSWFASPPSKGRHPVRLVVGLADVGTSRKSSWWSLTDSDMPRADRIIAIEWAETALGRGTVIGPILHSEDYSYARYIARGGAEHGSRWWTDNVDLSTLHQQLWPDKPLKNTEVRFVGVWSSRSPYPASMHIANLRLFR
jgi:hypothetical protein